MANKHRVLPFDDVYAVNDSSGVRFVRGAPTPMAFTVTQLTSLARHRLHRREGLRHSLLAADKEVAELFVTLRRRHQAAKTAQIEAAQQEHHARLACDEAQAAYSTAHAAEEAWWKGVLSTHGEAPVLRLRAARDLDSRPKEKPFLKGRLAKANKKEIKRSIVHSVAEGAIKKRA
ncbi:hypothetical protein C8R46DRAFT_502962 [Mycena filopes]|nr:hypothetical protein C8R46DRAFT_502962 [Mycena filopes]